MRCWIVSVVGAMMLGVLSLHAADPKEQVKEQPKELTKEMLEGYWKDLAGNDAEAAWDRIVVMRRFSKQSVPFLIEKIKPAAPPDMKRIDECIKNLSDVDFQTRQTAERELEKFGSLAEKSLRQALEGKLELETRRAIERVLDKIDAKQLSPDDLRIVRAFEVLEYVDDEAAIAHIKTLAKGADGACTTREAKETLERLTKRGKVK